MKKHYTLGLYPLAGNGYRKFCWPWWKDYLNPKTYYRTVKYFCQRGYRGYADCDAWDADSYLENITLGVIKRLKENNMGYPASLCDYAPGQEEPEGHVDSGAEKWQTILSEIIEGLEASYELKAEDTVPDDVYSKEPLEFEECEDNPGLLQLKESSMRFNDTLYKEWQAPLLKKRKRAVYLLHKHWGSFWD